MIALVWTFSAIFFLALVTSQAFVTAAASEYVTNYELRKLANNATSGVVNEEDHRDFAEPGNPASPNQTKLDDVPAFETETEEERGTLGSQGEIGRSGSNDTQSPLDPWSIVWYIGSFGGLVAFFLIVSCSEWCCRRGARPLTVPYTQRGEVITAGAGSTETPPPPYHLFAPPPYDSVNYTDKATGEKLDIYVIAVQPIQSPA